MAAFDKVLSGIPALDGALDYIRMGDNVVWRVSELEEFRRFAEKCKARNVELIPLLQSVGHLDYLLKYPKFRELRDGGPEGSSYQWCLADEASFELWRTMADELLAAFPDTKIFHIGADECRMNVPCPRCEANRLDLYVERVARCCRYIQGSFGKKML